MFDAGFWELTLILVLALLIVGPERLPGLAKKAGHWIGKMRRFVTSVRSDIEREFRTEELEKMLNQQNAEIQELKNILHETKAETETTFRETSAAMQEPPKQQQLAATSKPSEDDKKAETTTNK